MSPSEVDSTKDVEKKPSQRRINKPLIEKRRRARINDSLAQLKSIVLEASDSKGPRPSKLEKADILEMTVEFIKKKTIPKLNTGAYCSENPVIRGQDEYSAGYSKCLSEISKFLEETRFVDDASKSLIQHISNKFKPASGASDGPADSEINKNKIRIEPLRLHLQKECSQKVNEAVDLSIRGSKTKEKQTDQISFPQNVAGTGLIQSSPNGHVTNQQVPVGLVCGSHVMLLVQLPTSMTSQQLVKPNVIPLNTQMQAVQGGVPLGFVPVTPNCFSPASSNSAPVLSEPTVASSTMQNSTSNTAIDNATKSDVTLTDCGIKPEPGDSYPENKNQNFNNGIQTEKNHWRPW